MNNKEYLLIGNCKLLRGITLSNGNNSIDMTFNAEDSNNGEQTQTSIVNDSTDTNTETVLETSIGVDDPINDNKDKDENSMSNVVLLMGIIIIVLVVTVVALVSVLYNKKQNEKRQEYNNKNQEKLENAPKKKKKTSTSTSTTNKATKKNNGMPSIKSEGAGNVNSNNRTKLKNNKVQAIKTNKPTDSVSQHDDIEKAIRDAENSANNIINSSVTQTSINMDLADSPTLYTNTPHNVHQSSVNMENTSNGYNDTSVPQQNPIGSNVPVRAVPQQNPMNSNVPVRAVPQQNPMNSNVPVRAVPQQNPMSSNVPVRAVPQQNPISSNVSITDNVHGNQRAVKTPIVLSNETENQVQGFSDNPTMNVYYNSANTNNMNLKYIKYSNNTMFNLRFGKECEIILEDFNSPDVIFVLADNNKVYINPMYLNNVDKKTANNLLVYNINGIFDITGSAEKGTVSHITGCLVKKTDRGYELVQKGVIS